MYKKWSSNKATDDQIECILEFDRASQISSIDIGNDGSAFIEIFVSRSDRSDQWQILLPMTLLMTPSESRSNTNRNQVKLLKSSDLNPECSKEKWNRVKVVCEQKFDRTHPFGLCFIKFYSSPNSDQPSTTIESKSSILDEEDDETRKAQNQIGSFFARKKAEKSKETAETSAKEEIRALSNVAEQVLSRKSMDDEEIQQLLKANAQVKR